MSVVKDKLAKEIAANEKINKNKQNYEEMLQK